MEPLHTPKLFHRLFRSKRALVLAKNRMLRLKMTKREVLKPTSLDFLRAEWDYEPYTFMLCAAPMKLLIVLLSVAVSAYCHIKSDILPVSRLSLHGVMSIVIVGLV